MSDRQLLLNRRLRMAYRVYFEMLQFVRHRRIDDAARDRSPGSRTIYAMSPKSGSGVERRDAVANEYGIAVSVR